MGMLRSFDLNCCVIAGNTVRKPRIVWGQFSVLTLRVYPPEAHMPAVCTRFVIANNRACNTPMRLSDLPDNGHSHAYYEWILVTEGHMQLKLGLQQYDIRCGEAVWINHHIEHQELYGAGKYIIICIPLDFLMNWPILEPIPQTGDLKQLIQKQLTGDPAGGFAALHFIVREPADACSAIQLAEYLVTEMERTRKGQDMMVRGMFARLTDEFECSGTYCLQAYQMAQQKDLLLFERAIAYMQGQKRRIHRQDLAQALHYNGDYINRVIKKYTGFSAAKYMEQICMLEIEKRLLNTNRSVSDIALEFGFSNRTHFYKLFKRYFHTTPQEYRAEKSAHLCC